MLRGERIGLRARHEDDIPVLLAELHDDVAGSARAESAPWRPIPPGSKESRVSLDRTDDAVVPFSVVELGSGALLGSASLWGIDNHNRFAHLGLGLRPSARGRGHGSEVVALLCHYGFVVRGMRRLQVETVADNAAMLRAAESNGFVREGVLRSAAWVMGEFLDEVVFGLLVEEWKDRP
ncbi:GNAT family N-acetyltransferase [Kitasatospora sp. NPDC094019]|uniref:GNAT family N-acetyltransferase n=1 Tax=Kitasatospora sp. NPDC094019 TaxID=3364091 RepID=UPI00382F3DE4